MDWRPLLDFVFPAQCASCNAIGSGLCRACRPDGKAIAIYLPSLRVAAAAPYESTLRAAVLALKDGRRDVAEALGRMTAPLVTAGATLVPVPTTAKRRRMRGLDGVALVARCAAAIAGARVVLALEQRSGDAQRGRSRSQRLAAQGRFSCSAAGVAGLHVTLFDDVCTTGSTLRDCADAIREAGGLVDDAIVVAVANSPKPWSTSNVR
jgi:predicted amidophosphoribosyltransferase